MKKNVLMMVMAAIISLGLQSCTENKELEGNTARVQLKLIDFPGEYMEVNIEIIDIQYNVSDEGWTSFAPMDGGYPINVDLTELIAGNSLLLADEIVPSGLLKQIRLVLSDNNSLLIEGENEGESISTHLDTPSAQQSGLKLNLETELEPGFSYSFILDWDVQKSVLKAGNSGKYNLKPVIRVNAEVNSGSVSGTVIADDLDDDLEGAVPLKGAKISVFTTDDSEVATTFTDETGNFIIQGLDEGDYKIRIEHINYIEFQSEGLIKVLPGEITSLGTIELQVPVS